MLPRTCPSLLFVRMSFARCSLESSFRVGGGGGKRMTAAVAIAVLLFYLRRRAWDQRNKDRLPKGEQ